MKIDNQQTLAPAKKKIILQQLKPKDLYAKYRYSPSLYQLSYHGMKCMNYKNNLLTLYVFDQLWR